MNILKKVFCILLLATLTLSLRAQDSALESSTTDWTFGLGFGKRCNFMKITELASGIDGDKEMRGGGMFSLFAYKETADGGKAIRPQITFISRGAKYANLTSKSWTEASYCVDAKYIDFRLPLIMNLGTYRSGGIQPYFYLAPIMGMASGGEISLTEAKEGGKSVSADVSKSNLASWYVGAGAALGVKYNLELNDARVYLGFECMYDYGITNTYGKKEKDGDINDIANIVNYTDYSLDGKRKFSGLEFQVVVGVPLTVFKRKTKQPTPPPTVEEQPVVEADTVAVEEKPCFDLDEINEMIANGEDVRGKTICAVNNTINFDFGSAKIKPESYPYLDKLALTLKSTGANIKVNGHTDNKGTEAYNLKLSRDRAKSVVEYLEKQGIERDKLSSEGFGPNRPISDNATEEGRAMNRRVEFEILRETDNN